MKRASFSRSLGVLGFLCCAPAAAESALSPADRKVLAVATNLVTPFFGAYYLEANVRASRSFAVLVNVSRFTLDEDDWETKTTTLGAGLSYYWQGTALRRWYAEAVSELMFSPWRHKPSGQTSSTTLGASLSVIAGYRFVCDLGPLLDLGVGVVALYFPSARVHTDSGSVDSEALTKVYPGLKLNVGWAF